MMRLVVSVLSCVALAALSACGPQTGPAKTSDPASGAGTAAGMSPRPVMMGGESSEYACGSVARIKPGRFVLIRIAPDPNAEIEFSLPEGTMLWLCDHEGPLPEGDNEGIAPEAWTGVAFDMPDGPKTCEGVGTPSADRVPVPSVCQSGWVQFGDDAEMIAG